MERLLICLVLTLALSPPTHPEVTSSTVDPLAPRENDPAAEEPPEGYYAFVESPNATPPRVRPPPYRQVSAQCPEAASSAAHVTANNLCGDLNRGIIPRSPVSVIAPGGEPYPFELIRNHTLRFLSKTLPVLTADETLPRVAHLTAYPAAATDEIHGNGFCMLYRAINGDSGAAVERREDPGPQPARPQPAADHRYEGPPTPCPARVEYATPVFARNYQGVWRYVVQIPYEGYFTQTVEVTRCLQSRCHYLSGGCLSSPRWLSLLVAEVHYPTHYQGPGYIQRRADEAQQPTAAQYQGTSTQYQQRANEQTPYQQRPNSEQTQYQQTVGDEPTPYQQRSRNDQPRSSNTQNQNQQRPSSDQHQQRASSDQHQQRPSSDQHQQRTSNDQTHYQQGPSSDQHQQRTSNDQSQAQYRHKRAIEETQYRPNEEAATEKPTHCDGHDELGCYQVRLYYDWFLVPGSCKCWRPDYFARYVRRRQASPEL